MSMTGVRVEADRERCVGAGHCVRSLPAVFDQDEHDGRVLLLSAAPPAGLGDELHEVADLCPGRALTVHED
ncbi:ferredoxin [Streptomyces sp. 3211.6]|nr:ferredoxin [Streptomyces sp. 3211.6]